MKKRLCLLVFAFLASPHATTADEFAKVKCGGDIPKAVIGQRSSSGPVVATEKKYAGLGLKDLGGDEISDRLSTVNWMICGGEYVLLIDRGGLVRDVMAFPAHSKALPAFSGICQLRGKDLPDIFLAVLDGASAGDSLPVQAAWKIDQKQRRFVKVPGEELLCPRSGISTEDGGH